MLTVEQEIGIDIAKSGEESSAHHCLSLPTYFSTVNRAGALVAITDIAMAQLSHSASLVSRLKPIVSGTASDQPNPVQSSLQPRQAASTCS